MYDTISMKIQNCQSQRQMNKRKHARVNLSFEHNLNIFLSSDNSNNIRLLTCCQGRLGQPATEVARRYGKDVL